MSAIRSIVSIAFQSWNGRIPEGSLPPVWMFHVIQVEQVFQALVYSFVYIFRSEDSLSQLGSYAKSATGVAFASTASVAACSVPEEGIVMWDFSRPAVWRELTRLWNPNSLPEDDRPSASRVPFARWCTLRGVDKRAIDLCERMPQAEADSIALNVARAYWRNGEALNAQRV